MFNLLKFKIESRHFNITHNISAKNRKQAWCKFATLHFGPLKPDKKDWRISFFS